MKTIIIQHFQSPYGTLIVGDFEDKLCICDWLYRQQRNSIDTRIQNALNANYIESKSKLLDETIAQLNSYFSHKTKQFDIPLIPTGSEFQQSVWQELMKIPYGKTISYLQLAQQLQKESAIRAVAAANGANAISIIIPCHRVIGHDGKLTGYAGGLYAKQKLLQLESENEVLQGKLF